MSNTDWLRQTDKPLFEDILWSRPQNRHQMGRLLIVGGSSHGFSAPAQAYSAATASGAGSIRILLPDSVKKIVGKLIPEADYAPSTPSGSFSRRALAEMLSSGQWASAVMLAGDFGRNSETAIALGSFTEKFEGNLTLVQDSLDYFLNEPSGLLSKENCLIVTEFGQLQKLVTTSKSGLVIKFSMDLLMLVDALQKFSAALPVSIITTHNNNIIVASRGRVSTTKAADMGPDWAIKVAANATVLWMQNPVKIFESLTSAVYSG